jgi:uncharacterized protein
MSENIAVLHIRVKVVPRASATGVRGRMADDTVKISLRSPPADGRANSELIGFLAGEFGARPESVRLLSGAASRRKLLSIDSYTKIPDWFRN